MIKFKKWPPNYEKLILMFQKEVADKIMAKSESKEFGRISVITSSRLRITDSFQVSPNSFRPIPKIFSKVLVLEPFLNDSFKAKDINNLEKITHLFFSMKRKMVNKAFKNLFKDYVQAKYQKYLGTINQGIKEEASVHVVLRIDKY